MLKVEKTDLYWEFDQNKVTMHYFGKSEENASAILVVKSVDKTAICSGVLGGTVFKGMKFAVGYKEPSKHGWEIRVSTQELDLRVDAIRNLPQEAPEILFVNEGPSGAEIIAVIHGNGFGDIQRLRFPASSGHQWLGVLDFYLKYFGIDLKAISVCKEEKREVHDNEGK